MHLRSTISAFVGLWLVVCAAREVSFSSDWPRFRGPNGSGISPDQVPAPVRWSENENLAWKVELPGRGLSSPIVVGNRVLVTCYSGYGVDRDSNADMANLKRHLVCVDGETGKVLWDAVVPAALPDDPYSPPGVTTHGYASHTPASDGQRVYAFFGKSGVVAFDLEGKKLWQTSVGTGSGPQRWGSAASPIVHKDLVIVNASDESESLVALDKLTGQQRWRKTAEGFAGSWSTPVVVDSPAGAELVLAVPYEVWGFDPLTGKLKWYANGLDDQTMCSSLVPGDGVVYAIGARGGNTVAIRTGGSGDANATNVVWQGRAAGRFATALLHDGHLYSVNGGVAMCLDAKTGEEVYAERLASGESAARGGPTGGGRGPGSGGPGERRGGFGGERGGFGGGRGPGGGQDFASPVMADGKIYLTTKAGVFYILPAKPKFEILARNELTSDTSGFDATPAIRDGRILVRSNTHLYCVSPR